MRNLVVQALPAGATVSIEIKPPMVDGEHPYLLTMRGPGTAVVQVVHTGRVSISNPTDEISPFAFIIVKKPTIPPGVQNMLAALLGRTP